MLDKLTRLLDEYDSVIKVLDERVQTRAGLQTPTALRAIQRIRDIRGRLGQVRASANEDMGAYGLELQRAAEDLQDCSGEDFPRIATNLYGIAEELQRLGGTD